MNGIATYKGVLCTAMDKKDLVEAYTFAVKKVKELEKRENDRLKNCFRSTIG